MEDLYSFSSKRLPYIEFPDFILKKGGLQYFEQTETKKKKKTVFIYLKFREIKASMRYHLIPVRMAMISKAGNNKC